jgi:hypothetical protein
MPNLINNLTNFADQLMTLQLADGTNATVELLYNGTTERWTMNVSYAPANFSVNGIGVCCYPNLLRQWRNLLPFGLACTSADQTDPVDVNDFYTGRVSLYVLTATDVQAIEETIFGSAVQI